MNELVRDWDAGWVTPLKDGRLADAIEAYVRQYDWVTFVELLRKFEPYAEVRGTMALEIAPNVLLWVGMSAAFCDAINQLQQEKRIWPWPASMLSYFIDGGGLRAPLAKRIPKGGYKSERWLPVCFRIEEPV